MLEQFKNGAATITAVIAVIGIGASVIWLVAVGKIEAETALAFLGPILGAATTYLWIKQAAKDSAKTALSSSVADLGQPDETAK